MTSGTWISSVISSDSPDRHTGFKGYYIDRTDMTADTQISSVISTVFDNTRTDFKRCYKCTSTLTDMTEDINAYHIYTD